MNTSKPVQDNPTTVKETLLEHRTSSSTDRCINAGTLAYFARRFAIGTIYICLVLYIFPLIGCFDIFKEKEEQIVGNISVINPDNEEDKGYRMVIYEKEYNSNVLNEYVASVNGNDSLLIVKCIDKKECTEAYYKINHNKGKSPLKVLSINFETYTWLNSHFKWNYFFSDDSYVCP